MSFNPTIHPSLPPLQFDAGLDDAQRLVVEHYGATMAIAGPGSGKTRVLVAKASKYIATEGADALALVTFSKASATEMQERLAKRVGKTTAQRVQMGTFHSFCYAMLRQHWRAQRVAEPRLLKDGEAIDLIRAALREKGRPDDYQSGSDMAAKLSAIKLGKTGTPEDKAILDRFTQLKKQSRAIDFDDMVMMAADLLDAGQIPPLKVKHLLVDEYQDVDPVQVRWLDAHHRAGIHLHLVGDDDQAIYGFRSSLGYSAMRHAIDNWGAKPIYMSTNYRCDRDIVAVAACVLGQVQDRFQKDIQPSSSEDGVISLQLAKDENTEVLAVLKHFQGLQEQNGATAQLAVLSRTNEQLASFEQAAAKLMAEDTVPFLPIQRMGGKSLIDSPIIQRRLAVLKTLIAQREPQHLITALGAINVSAEAVGIVYEHLSTLKNHGELEHVLDPLFDTALMEALGRDDRTNLRDARDAYNQIHDEWNALVDRHGTAGDIPDEETNDFIRTSFKRIDPLEKRMVAKIHPLAEKILISRRGPLHARLAALANSGDKKEIPDSGIVLLTAHSSKGLEFDNVWIYGATETKFPLIDKGSMNAITPGFKGKAAEQKTEEQKREILIQLDEERRLMYVACTRARHQLTISFADKAGLFVREIQHGGETIDA